MKSKEATQKNLELFTKACSCCGKKREKVPADNKMLITENQDFDGLYFNCECGTTIFIPAYMIQMSDGELEVA